MSTRSRWLAFGFVSCAIVLGCGSGRAKSVLDEKGERWLVAECKSHPNVCLQKAGNRCPGGYAVKGSTEDALEAASAGVILFRCKVE